MSLGKAGCNWPPRSWFRTLSPPAPGPTVVQSVTKHWSERHPSVKKSVKLSEIQLSKRFISNAPCAPQVMMMKLSPLLKFFPAWLSEQQVAVADMHFARSYRAAKQALGLVGPSSASSSSSPPPRAAAPARPLPPTPPAVQHKAVRFAGYRGAFLKSSCILYFSSRSWFLPIFS